MNCFLLTHYSGLLLERHENFADVVAVVVMVLVGVVVVIVDYAGFRLMFDARDCDSLSCSIQPKSIECGLFPYNKLCPFTKMHLFN